MNKIALITDTAADLSKEIIDKYNIKVLPFRIIYKDREYLDRVDITPQEVYNRFKDEIPTSSLPAMQDMENLYVSLENEGYTHAVIITLSTGLSGVLGGFRVVSENHPHITTLLFDSKSISMGEGIQVIECAKLIEAGKSFEEIADTLPSIQKKIHLYFVVGTLEYLIKGGRIGRVSGTIGELLNIKPIISLDENGVYYPYAKVRGRKQSINKLIQITDEIISKHKSKVYIMDGGAPEECKKIYEAVTEMPNISSCIYGGNISPVSCVHSGPGLIGCIIVEED